MMFFIFQHKFMFLCRASNNVFLLFSSPNNNFSYKNSLFSPRAPNSGKRKVLGTFLEPKVTQNRFSLFLQSKQQKAPRTRFERKSAKFCKNGCFYAPEVFILRPSRKPFCRQCFFRCFEAHFHPFRTFSLIFSLFRKKVILSAKNRFVGQKVFFAFWGTFLDHFRTLAQTLL